MITNHSHVQIRLLSVWLMIDDWCSHISARHGLTYSLMNSWTCSVCPVSPDASATVTLFKQCEKENTSPSIPRVKSLAMSAVETALLDTLSFSLQNTHTLPPKGTSTRASLQGKQKRFNKKKKKKSILHFFLHLLADELFSVCSYFIRLVTAKQHWDLILNHACIGKNVVKVPGEVQNRV